jgi:hypothetical protein
MKKVTCKLTGEDGNAFAIIGRVQKALRQAGTSQEVKDKYFADATSGDYNHLLDVSITTLEDHGIEWS